ncbi:hypothetical protein [Vibrio echinoideorum]|uniref:HNH nuclease domain-containing protein n=1 Tax=Vibrio echinoideorum TaxID=2100116 RepID=A0ABU9FSC2_9VIBR
MIKYDFKITKLFLSEYDKLIVPGVKSSIQDLISTSPNSCKSRLMNLFTDKFIESLLKCKPEDLEFYIETIYNNLPELSDLYYPAYNLRSINLTESDLDMRADQSNETYYEKLRTSTAYNLVKNNPNSNLSKYLADTLWSAKDRSESKSALKKVLSYKQGAMPNSKFIANSPSLFLNWAKDFSDCFDYECLRDKLGYEFILDLDIDICLYCNKEEINTILGDDGRYKADLDHFHPKSKFPFLAVTLSNLIPSGEKCNQRFKRDKTMFDHAHPYIEGVKNDPLFSISPTQLGSKLNKNNFKINIEEQGGGLDNNIDMFAIKSAYNQNLQIRTWVVATHSKAEFFKNFGLNIEVELKKTHNMIYVDLNEQSHKVYAKKFKVDIINKIASSKIKFS